MLINIIGFNVAWFGLVFWGNLFVPVAIAMLTLHIVYISKLKYEPFLILLITLIGIGVDSLLQFNSIFIFEQMAHIPLWLCILWACFAATICHSLSFLTHSKALQLMIGGIVSPLSYVAGANLNAVQFSMSLIQTYLILVPIWAALFILFFSFKSYLFDTEVTHA